MHLHMSYELANLQGGVQYDIQVRAVNATGDGPWSATVTQVQPEAWLRVLRQSLELRQPTG